MKNQYKSVKIDYASYLQLEEIRLALLQRKLNMKKNEVLSYALLNLYKKLNDGRIGNA